MIMMFISARGATHQFSMIAYNYKHLSGTADYVTTGLGRKSL